MNVVTSVLPGYEASNAEGWHHHRRSRVDLTTLLLPPPPMASDPPDTDQAVRAASRCVHRTRPGNPADDPVALALFSPPPTMNTSQTRGHGLLTPRPPSSPSTGAAPVPRPRPGTASTTGVHPPRPTPSRPCSQTMPPTSNHTKPWRPIAYAGPWSSGPPPASVLPHMTRPAPPHPLSVVPSQRPWITAQRKLAWVVARAFLVHFPCYSVIGGPVQTH